MNAVSPRAPSPLARWTRALGSAALACLACSLTGGAAFAQVLVSDKDDYAPAETAWLAGAGFQPLEQVGLSLLVATPTDEAIDYAVGGVFAGADGGFSAAWLVPYEAIDSQITATAVGLSSGRIAVAHFTDHAPHTPHNFRFATSGLGVAIPVVMSGMRTIPGAMHPSQAWARDFMTPGPSASTSAAVTVPTGAAALASFFSFAGFPASVPGNGGVYHLIEVSHASPIAVPTTGGTTTITAFYGFTPDVVCPVNNAPTLSANDLFLGDLVGCLGAGGSFGRSAPVALGDFAPVTNDADGDPVTVTLDAGSVSLVGPGLAEATVTLTATDDPSARNVSGCAALAPQSAQVVVKVRARIVYARRVLPPLTVGGTGLFKKGSTIPLKVRFEDCCGNEIPRSVLETGPESDGPKLASRVVSSITPTGDFGTFDAGGSNDNGYFLRYSESDHFWIYNLQTKDAAWCTSVLYAAEVVTNDGVGFGAGPENPIGSAPPPVVQGALLVFTLKR